MQGSLDPIVTELDHWWHQKYGEDEQGRVVAIARPEEVAMVGDNRHDLEMARAAGAGAAIGVLTGNSSFDDLSPLADAVIRSIADLPDWLAWRAEQP